MSKDKKVISLTDRLAQVKQQADDEQAKLNNFEPTVQDIHTFLMVLRHLQKRSSSQAVEIECAAEFLQVKITESTADELTNKAMFFDVQQKARIITFDFPWHILDLDKSELSLDDDGTTAVDHLGGAIRRWFNDIAIIN